MNGFSIRLISILIVFSAVSLAAAELPSSFYQAMSGMKNQDVLCVKNYDAGASITESYSDFGHLEKETQVVSRSYNASWSKLDYTRQNASLEANLDSNVIGYSHIAWQSKELIPDRWGRHAVWSRATEDLTGVFDVEKYIQLWSNSTIGSSALDWLPCG
jgi:hypothetical protein